MNAKSGLEPHPEARIVAWTLAVIGGWVTADVRILGTGWVLLLIVLGLVGQFRRHTSFLLMVLAPLAVVMITVWWRVVGAPPHLPFGSNPDAALTYAVRTVLQLGIVGAASQLAFLTIRPDEIWPFARRLGVRGQFLVMILSSFALSAGMPKVVDQTLTCMKARGAIRPNSYSSRFRAIPLVAVNIWRRLIADQFQRVELKWAPQQTLRRVEEIEVEFAWNRSASACILSVAAIWFAICLASSLHD